MQRRIAVVVFTFATLACGPRQRATQPLAQPDVAPRPAAIACPTGTTAHGDVTQRAWCERSDGAMHGPVRAVFPSGALALEGSYDAGVKHGLWRNYYDGGQLRSEEHYDRGKPIGTWVTYFADGRRATESLHRDDGSVAFRSFDETGRKLRQGVLVDGVEHGEWTEWDAAGTELRSRWDHGRKTSSISGGIAAIGVASCDEYIAKLTACVTEKVPDAARKPMMDALEASAVAWREAAAGPGRDGLESACRVAIDAARQATQAMGCSW